MGETSRAGTEPPAGTASGVALRAIELDVVGMTCSSCAARIERKLNRLPGVEASVNYATESASVRIPPDLPVETVIDTVRATGYDASVVPLLHAPEAVEAQEPESRPDHELEDLRQRFWVSLALAVPVSALAMVPALQFTFWQWLSLTLAAPVVVWGAWPFHRATVINLRHGAVTMDTLISLGTIAAFAWSLWALFLGGAGEPGYRMSHSLVTAHGGMGMPDLYLEVAAAVPVFILAGRWFEARSKRRAGAALRSILDLSAKDVAVLENGTERRRPVRDLAPGMRFVVRPGERIATDGLIVEGESAVDESLLTGESVPVEVGPGSPVTGATINIDGRLVVEATRVGEGTRLARIAQLVREAQGGKAPVQRLADRISMVFVPAVIAVSLVTLGTWLLRTGSAEESFAAAVAVLIIACPCALGLATPIALLVGTGRGASVGVLIRGPEVLESTRRVDTIVLDKTGTVTEGRMEVVDALAAPGADLEAVLALAASVESASEHPVGRALARADNASAVTEFVNARGRGVSGTVDGVRVAVGRPDWVAPGAGHDWADDWARGWQERAATVVAVGWDDGTGMAVRGMVAIADAVRPSSARAIAELRRLGLEPVLLTGDSAAAGRSVAAMVGIDRVISEVAPEGKVDEVRRMQADGRVVAMVGDGVNDAAALAQADLGIAMGGGADAAIEASDLTLVRTDLMAAVDAIRLSRRTLRTIKGNLFWAFAYNVSMIPVAAAGLLNPLLSGAAMALSSVFVVANSLRLRGFEPLA